MKSSLHYFWAKVVRELKSLQLLDYKKKVKRVTTECLKEYLGKEKISYQSIELTTVKQGMNYRACDGGSFLVKVRLHNNQALKLFAKRNTKLKWLCLARPPFKFKKTFHLEDHNYRLHQYIFQRGIKVPQPFFSCKKRRVIIMEYVEGLPLKKALKTDFNKTVEIFKEVSRRLGRLHLLNIAYRKLKPQHIFINLDSGEITFIDCELLIKTKSLNDFSNDLKYLSQGLFYNFHKEQASMLYEKLLEGYREVIDQETYQNILTILEAEVKEILDKFLFKKIFFKLLLFLSDALNRLSRGYLRI